MNLIEQDKKQVEHLQKVIDDYIEHQNAQVLKEKIIKWANYRHQNEGKITPELARAIVEKIELNFDSVLHFCLTSKGREFPNVWISKIKNGHQKFITSKVVRLCYVLGIEIENYVYFEPKKLSNED